MHWAACLQYTYAMHSALDCMAVTWAVTLAVADRPKINASCCCSTSLNEAGNVLSRTPAEWLWLCIVDLPAAAYFSCHAFQSLDHQCCCMCTCSGDSPALCLPVCDEARSLLYLPRKSRVRATNVAGLIIQQQLLSFRDEWCAAVHCLLGRHTLAVNAQI